MSENLPVPDSGNEPVAPKRVPVRPPVGRTPLGFMARLTLIVAVLAVGYYVYKSYAGTGTKLEKWVREDTERQTGRTVKTVRLKNTEGDFYRGTLVFTDGEELDVDARVIGGNHFQWRTLPQQPVIEQFVRDTIAEMGFEPKTVTISRAANGDYSGTADATTGERFRVYEKSTVRFPGPIHLGDFSSESQIMVEIVP